VLLCGDTAVLMHLTDSHCHVTSMHGEDSEGTMLCCSILMHLFVMCNSSRHIQQPQLLPELMPC
jgi:hypothetical protein